MNTYRAGDAIAFSAALKVNGAADNLAGVTVQAALVDPTGALVPGSVITASVTDAAGGQVAGVFSTALTAGLAAGVYAIAFKESFAQGPMHYEPAAIRILPALIP